MTREAVDDVAHGVDDEEAHIGGLGQREGDGGAAGEGVGIVLLGFCGSTKGL